MGVGGDLFTSFIIACSERINLSDPVKVISRTVKLQYLDDNTLIGSRFAGNGYTNYGFLRRLVSSRGGLLEKSW
jgi:hypothetical protein